MGEKFSPNARDPLLRETLKEKVNEHVGNNWVRYIKFTLDRHGVPNAEEMSPEFKKFLDLEKD